jgi:hypothetical protein
MHSIGNARRRNDRLDSTPQKTLGDKDHLTVFASEVAANVWFTEHDPEGVAFEYSAIE